MFLSYLPFWMTRGPDGDHARKPLNYVTDVTAHQMNAVLGNVLKLILSNIGSEDAPWMNRIASKLCGVTFTYVFCIFLARKI